MARVDPKTQPATLVVFGGTGDSDSAEATSGSPPPGGADDAGLAKDRVAQGERR